MPILIILYIQNTVKLVRENIENILFVLSHINKINFRFYCILYFI